MLNLHILQMADYFFVLFHTCLILFNLFGWLWKPLQKWQLLTISLTFASWLGLGIWYGLGYCPLTDWHWDILRQMGETNLPNSYISYLFQRLLGLKLPDLWVDVLTVSMAILALAASIWVNFFQKRKGNSIA
ncbi:hypothetical protein P872_13815 [Rhodonellum psychrophilum GCM71 = DSM 17998]|uniref:DUF2784 domain-containing protein n=3 Tax=Cytophagaceae TaxID=89373 RepID=U5BS89_9BACT|nr:hypothetical protein P872_13815 [Rhodonellum psychrophilum GCM71 = DSM 17998]SDY39103.1 Protein of Unknown function [Rhodonellum ikkaensis]